MAVVVRGKLRDLASLIASIGARDRVFRKAGSGSLPPGAMNLLAARLHPLSQELRVASVDRRSPGISVYRLVAAKEGRKPAAFRAGQYVACSFAFGDSLIARPFSICSSPADALGPGFYEIAAKSYEGGFISSLLPERWKPGEIVVCSGPAGAFHYQPLRDGPEIVCLAGGTGITPFRSIIADSLSAPEGPSFFLFHGARSPEELLFAREFLSLEERHPNRLKYVPVCEKPAGGWSGRVGFITLGLVEEFARLDGRQSFFVCGPPGMQAHLDRELAPLGLPPKRLRRESYGMPPAAAGEAPRAGERAIFLSRGARGAFAGGIPAREGETILVALERAGLSPPSLCRGGSCGWCRSRLVSGAIETPLSPAGLRLADRKFGYFHPCVSFPRSDIVMDIPDNPIDLDL